MFFNFKSFVIYIFWLIVMNIKIIMWCIFKDIVFGYIMYNYVLIGL